MVHQCVINSVVMWLHMLVGPCWCVYVYVVLFGIIHIIAAFNLYVNRILTLPITKHARHQEWKTILAIAQNNGFPLHIMQSLKKKLTAQKN